MNIRRYTVITALVGAVCCALRFMQQRTGFEAETGLALRGNLFAVLLAVALVLFGAVLALLIRRLPFRAIMAKDPFAALFAMEGKDLPKTFAIGGAMVVAIGGGLELFEAVTLTRDVLALAAGALAVVAGICLFGAVKALAMSREADGVYLLAAVCCAVVQLVASYRLYAVDPVLQSYYVELLSFVAHALSFYALCGLYFTNRGFGRFAFFTLAALVLTFTSLADSHALSEVLGLVGMSAVELGFLLSADENFTAHTE